MTFRRVATNTDGMSADRVTPVQPGLADVLEIIPRYVDEVVVQTVRDTQRAWTDRVYGAVNRATHGGGATTQQIHQGVSEAVFATIGLGLKATSLAASGAARVARGRGPGLTSPRARTVWSALNGLLGDRFHLEGSPLTITMSVRLDGADVALEPVALAAAFPSATDRVVVFLHGLGEHEGHWQTRREELGTTYAETLAAEGWTPVLLRINTGLSLRENGAALTGLLQDLVAAWPTEVCRIALVGHSMGGLIARAGCAVAIEDPGARESNAPWRTLVTDVVTLGTPHLGADLARVVGVGSRHLARLPETAAFGRILDQRSVGIVDLSEGLPDLEAATGVRYRLVSGSLDGAWGALVGDVMVRRPSATGRSRQRHLFPDADVLHLPGAGHFELLNRREVQEALKVWLA